MVDLFPMPSGMNISRPVWIAMTPVLRDEIIRMWQELSAGEAIAKDRRCGRPKSHRKQYGDSFHALHLLDMEIWHRPNAKKIAEADALRERLAPDEERMRVEDERNASLEEFHQMAAAGGTNVAAVLREYVGLENLIRQDPVKGLKILGRRVGVDWTDVLANALEANAEVDAVA